MAMPIGDILDVLRERGIEPDEEPEAVDLPGIGQVEEGETIYSTSVAEVFAQRDEERALGDDRLGEWTREIERVVELEPPGRFGPEARRSLSEPPEPHCAWYCPIHFYGHSWGIFIRESCILARAVDIARFMNWYTVPTPIPPTIFRQLLRSAFYVLYLHEQFHHKVESMGFRLLITTGSDRYRPYKNNVYKQLFLTPDCLEETLANAESYRRLNEERYAKRLDKPIRDALREFLKVSFRLQPPGYEGAVHFIGSQYRPAHFLLQSQILDGCVPHQTPLHHWSIAPNVITSLMDISDDIYVILPIGFRPIFRPTSIDPGFTVSSRNLIDALIRYYGYHLTPGGKGSHVKLTKAGAPNIHIPGNRAVVAPGVVKQVLGAFGGYPLSRLPDLLDGKLAP